MVHFFSVFKKKIPTASPNNFPHCPISTPKMAARSSQVVRAAAAGAAAALAGGGQRRRFARLASGPGH